MLEERSFIKSGDVPVALQSPQLVTFGELAECTCKLPNTVYRRASSDPAFPEPVGVVRVSKGARRRMAFRADELRDWIVKEIERRRLDPAALVRFDQLLSERGVY